MPDAEEQAWRESALRFIEYVVEYIADRGGLLTGKSLVQLLLDDIRLETVKLLDAVIREDWELSIELHREIQELLVELSFLGD